MAKKIGIILLIFICFYMGAHYWIRWRNTVTDDVSKVSRLVDCDANEVRGIKILTQRSGKEETLSFSRSDTPQAGVPAAAQLTASEWKYVAPIVGEADASAMVRLSSLLCELYDPTPIREEEFQPGNGAPLSVTFDVQGGAAAGTHAFQFGKPSSDRMSIVKYQGPGGGARVLKLPPKMAELGAMPPKEYLNTRILRFVADNVTVVKVFSKDKERFTLEREGSGWKVIAGGKELGRGNEEASKFVNRLTTLRAIGVNPEGLSPAACDKAMSQVSVELTGIADKKEMVFFQFEKKGPLSVCNTSREALFTVHRDFIPYVETPAEKLLAKP